MELCAKAVPPYGKTGFFSPAFRLFYREENAYSTVNVAACVVTLLVALRTTQRYIWPLR